MSKQRAHYFQHVAFEGLGSIEAWLTKENYEITVTKFFNPDYQLPNPGDVDLLIIMGGPMSVNDEDQHLWLKEEKQFIRNFLTTGKSVLGICLGAQLIASALGANVYPNNEPEIGWFSIHGIDHQRSDLFQFPTEETVFHWHGETFDLPENATLLASSYACNNQVFQIGNNVIGMQCHLETTSDSVQALVKHCGDELVIGNYVQSSGQILFAPEASYVNVNTLMDRLLAYLLSK